MTVPAAALCRTLGGLPRSLRLYPEGHPRAPATLRAALRMTRDGVRVNVDDDGMSVNGRSVETAPLEFLMRDRGIASVVIGRSATEDDLHRLAALLAEEPDAVLRQRDEHTAGDLDGGGLDGGGLRIEWTRSRDGREDGDGAEPDEDAEAAGGARERDASGGAVEVVDDASAAGTVRWQDAGQADLWQEISRDAMRRRMEDHDPLHTWFAIVCRLYFSGPTAGDRSMRRAALERAVRQCGEDLDVIRDTLADLTDEERRELEALAGA